MLDAGTGISIRGWFIVAFTGSLRATLTELFAHDGGEGVPHEQLFMASLCFWKRTEAPCVELGWIKSEAIGQAASKR